MSTADAKIKGSPKGKESDGAVSSREGKARSKAVEGKGAGGKGKGKGKKPSDFRNGDWYCPIASCKAHNFASRKKCYLCSSPPKLPSTFKPGDWMCPQCTAHNYRNKQNCFKCRTVKPTGNSNMREGDWMCPFCGAHNFKDKVNCYQCQKPAIHNVGGFDMGFTPFPPKFKPGDWLCSCGAHNYRSRTACFQCGTNKPTEQQRQQQQAALSQLIQMRQTGASAGGQQGYPLQNLVAQASMGAGGQVAQGLTQNGVKVPANFRPGDWMCQCGAHNFKSKTQCYRCDTPKAEGSTTMEVSAAAAAKASAGAESNDVSGTGEDVGAKGDAGTAEAAATDEADAEVKKFAVHNAKVAAAPGGAAVLSGPLGPAPPTAEGGALGGAIGSGMGTGLVSGLAGGPSQQPTGLMGGGMAMGPGIMPGNAFSGMNQQQLGQPQMSLRHDMGNFMQFSPLAQLSQQQAQGSVSHNQQAQMGLGPMQIPRVYTGPMTMQGMGGLRLTYPMNMPLGTTNGSSGSQPLQQSFMSRQSDWQYALKPRQQMVAAKQPMPQSVAPRGVELKSQVSTGFPSSKPQDAPEAQPASAWGAGGTAAVQLPSAAAQAAKALAAAKTGKGQEWPVKQQSS